MPQTPIVEIKNVSFGYDPARPVLRDINLAITPGAVVGIMGQSGCGKTTLLRIIMGAHLPSSGEARVLGHATRSLDTAALYEMRRRMGMLFQFGALFTDMSVYENVAFPLREHCQLPGDLEHDLVMLKLQAVGLRGAAHLMPTELSGGMARRVALARALALDPPLMLYDEPLAGLDPITKGVILALIRQLNRTLGLTSVVVSHDVPDCLAIADRVEIVANGTIAHQVTPAELAATTDPLLRQFLDGAPDGPIGFDYRRSGVRHA